MAPRSGQFKEVLNTGANAASLERSRGWRYRSDRDVEGHGQLAGGHAAEIKDGTFRVYFPGAAKAAGDRQYSNGLS